MLESLTGADFEAHLNEVFTVTLEDGQVYPLTLLRVTERSQPYWPGGRLPFNLLFQNPRKDAYLPQRTYQLAHPHMGAFELFIVPVGANDAGMLYEIIFS
jgi:hypothetical protein